MSALGLGRVKTFALPARVEHLEGTAPRQSPIMLRSRRSIPRYRIVFSTSRRCMSFHTARVIRVRPTRFRRSRHVRFAPESGHPIFHAALDGCTEFELTHWTGQQLATTYVNRCSQVKEDIHSRVTFKQWITDRR